jgi:hypothetical protein
MTSPKLTRLPFAAWPEIDRGSWDESPPLLSKLNSRDQRRVRDDYGRFLWLLSHNGDLDPSLPPASRVTPDLVRCYASRLMESGYTRRVVDNKLWALRKALQVMQPGCDVSFVNRVGRQRRSACARNRLRRPWSLGASKPRRDPLRLWPEIDRALWELYFHPRSLLDGFPGKPLRPDTIQQIIEGYGNWLKFLHVRGRLDCAVKPSERLQRSMIGEYVTEMLEAGRSRNTVISRLYSLRSAVTRMEPDVSLRWLTWPNGQSLLSQLPKAKIRKRCLVESQTLYEWGLQLITDFGNGCGKGRRWLASMLRDGLLIGVLAARAPRLMSMSRLRVGDNLTRVGNKFRLNLKTEDLKAGEAVEYDLPESLTPAFERYLAIRSELPDARSHSFLWVTQQGRPLSRSSIGGMVRCRSKERFGFTFGPHSFRHALATSAALHDPDHPGVASSILNNSAGMVRKHYNLSDVMHSAKRFHDAIKRIRRDTKSLAAREFRKQRVKYRRD